MSEDNNNNYKNWLIRAGVYGTVAFFGVPTVVSSVDFKTTGVTADLPADSPEPSAPSASSTISSMATGTGDVVAKSQSTDTAEIISKTLPSTVETEPKVSKTLELASNSINKTGYYTNVVVSKTKDACSKVAECNTKAIELVKTKSSNLASSTVTKTKNACSKVAECNTKAIELVKTKSSNLASGTVTMTKNTYSKVADACNISK